MHGQHVGGEEKTRKGAVRPENLENGSMNGKHVKYICVLMTSVLALGAAAAQADCFKSVSLGEYSLGEWSDAGRTWVVSDTIGSFSDVVTTVSAAQIHRDTLIGQCSTKGNAVIAEIERRLNEQKAGLGAAFDRECGDGIFCAMIREISIQSREYEINREIAKMKGWYQVSIERCEDHFNYTFDTLSPRMCEP